MHDFSCTDPDDMNFKALAERARYYKRDEKGVAIMCKIMEDMRKEAAKEAALGNTRETAARMIKKGKISLEEIILEVDNIKESHRVTPPVQS